MENSGELNKNSEDMQKTSDIREKIENKRRMRRKKSRKRLIVLICSAFFIAAALYMADVWKDMSQNSLKEAVTIELSGNESIDELADILSENKIIRHKNVFISAAKAKNLDKNYSAGKYTVKPGMKYTYILRMFYSTYKENMVTLAEGLTKEEIFKKISESGYSTLDELNAAQNEQFDYEFLKDINRNNALEGYLFPETYSFSNKQSAKEIINTMLSQFDKVFKEEYKQRCAELGMSVDEAVILASVIQAETRGGENMRLVSDVFHKRLKNGDNLQSCATVQYILKEKKPVLSAQDIKIDSPYNTYMYSGLPIGPVCSPGEQAIYAALYPKESDYYYFQSDENGNMYFSKTFEEHENIRKQIQKGN